MIRILRFPRLLDLYVTRIAFGSFLICFCFFVGLFVLIDLFDNIDDFTANIELLPEEYKRLGFLLVVAYYLTYIPFLYLLVAPFVTVTAGMFAVSRLMGANEVVPMLFTGRRLGRILVPVFLMGIGNALLMVGMREFVLPELVTTKDNLHHMLDKGKADRSILGGAIRLPEGNLLFFRRYWIRSEVIEGMNVRLPMSDGPGEASLRARRAEWVPQHAEFGPGWILTDGKEERPGQLAARVVDFLPAERIAGLKPVTLRNRIKESRELMDLSFSTLMYLVADQPNVLEYAVALHHHITFPLANILLLLLALPFALRFERSSKTERMFFALLVCGAYLVVDLIFQNLGKQGVVNPVVAAWFPTVLFGSLGVVIFDAARS